MVPTERNKLVIGLMVIVAVVGLVESLTSRNWDLSVVFALLVVFQVVLVAQLQLRRPSVPLRKDLVRWLAEQSAATGEPLERLADRCVAAHRAGHHFAPPDSSP